MSFMEMFKKYDYYEGKQVKNPLKVLPNGTFCFNLSVKDEYYTQRNNKAYPFSSCNTTALVNSLIAAGIGLKTKVNVQPEDDFTHILETKEAVDLVKKRYKKYVLKDGSISTEPRLIAYMLAWAAWKKLNKKVALYNSKGRLEDLIYNMVVEKGTGIGLGSYTKKGHYVSFVGFQTRQSDIMQIQKPDDVDIKELICLIQDDPWGDFRTKYKIQNGNDIEISIDRYNKILWGNGNAKCLIFIRKKAFSVEGFKSYTYPV